MTSFGLREITLRCIYEYDCEDCGTMNLVRPIKVELDPETAQALKEQNNESLIQGEWVTMPTVVSCKNCGSSFSAIDDE